MRPTFAADRLSALQAELDEARDAAAADPRDEMKAIWHGRRLAYLGRYNDAIKVYSDAIEIHPRSYKLRRHRGRRYITTRRFDLAVKDLTRAADLSRSVPDEVEPDGAPNALGIPRSTTQSNIFYHLGLAHFLRGEYGDALDAYRQCMQFASVNDDMYCATSYWLYLTLRRLGRDSQAERVLAPITEDMDIIENHAYHALLLMYKGRLAPEDVLAGVERESVAYATTAFGVTNWHALLGYARRADAMLEGIARSPAWAAFGAIAAEADLARRASPAASGPH